MQLSPKWEYVSDRVMGGVSDGGLEVDTVDGRRGARLRGLVSLDNNGGFVQMAFDLAEDGKAVDASSWTGIEFDVFGNDEFYEVRLRTSVLTRPWQSFRAPFKAMTRWQTVRIPFDSLESHRTKATFDASQLRRIGILAIGRVFEADITVAGVRFYK
ncbi:MAG: CIA30 family protein [Roseobacter sp.]